MALGFDTPRANFTELSAEQKALHLLNRITYGPRPADVERIKRIGIERFLDEQLNASAIDDSAVEKRVAGIEIFKMDSGEVLAKYPQANALLRATGDQANMPNAQATGNDTEAERRERREKLRGLYAEYDLRQPARLQPQITANRVLRAAYSERQLQEVMVDFWQNHFNVFAGKGAVRWYIPSYERDVLRKHALGNFLGLLTGTAKHPAMLFYLDNFESVSPTAARQPAGAQGRFAEAVKNGTLTPQMRERFKRNQGITDAQLDERIKRIKTSQTQAPQRRQRGLNENYARELMELHTLGVDGGYKQSDILEVAKAFSGWTIADPRGYRKISDIGEKEKAENMNSGERPRRQQARRAARLLAGVESGEFYFNERQHHKGRSCSLAKRYRKAANATASRFWRCWPIIRQPQSSLHESLR